MLDRLSNAYNSLMNTGHIETPNNPTPPGDLFHEVLGPNATNEQKDLLEFTIGADEASRNILTRILKYKSNPELLERITDTIKRGEWKHFLDDFRTVDDAHYMLLAAYCFCPESNCLSTQQLTTAFYFLSVAMDDENYQIHNLDEFKDKYEYSVSEEIESIKNDPHFDRSQYVAISCKKMRESAATLLGNIFAYSDPIPGVIPINKSSYPFSEFAIPSVYMMERLIFKNNTDAFKPVLGITPRKNFIDDVLNKKEHPLALLLPDSNALVHGVPCKGGALFLYLHDFYHATRQTTKETAKDPFKAVLIQIVESVLDKRKLNLQEIELGYVHPHLAKGATQDDLITKFLLELEGMVMDSDGADCISGKHLRNIGPEITENLIRDFLDIDLKYVETYRIKEAGNKKTIDRSNPVAKFSNKNMKSARDAAFELIITPFLEALKDKSLLT